MAVRIPRDGEIVVVVQPAEVGLIGGETNTSDIQIFRYSHIITMHENIIIEVFETMSSELLAVSVT